ncbi:MAG: type II and III secretion system protein [Bryobacteraceae bacterium]
MKCVWILCLLSTLALAAGPGARAFEEAQAAEKSGDTVHAYLLYSRAATLEPGNAEYQKHRDAIRRKMAVRELPPLDVDREDDGRWRAFTGSLPAGDLAEARIAMPPPELQASAGRKDFDLSGTPQEMFEKVGKAFGFEIMFEKDYQPTASTRIHLTEVDYREALQILEAATNTFVVPISEHKLLAARDTAQKRQELQSTLAIAIEIPARLTVQDAQELVSLVQQVLEIRRITVDPKRKLIFIRDAVTKAVAAKRILEDLSRYRPQVTVDLDLMSVGNTSSLSAGVNLQSTAPLIDFGRIAFGAFSPSPAGFTNFLTFGGGRTFFGIGVASARLFANTTEASSVSILKSQLTATDGLPTSLHVGDKYPIATNAYIGAGSNGGSGQVYTPPPTINFEDLGIVLKVTPTIHSADEVSLDIESEFKVLGSMASNGIPVISTRKFTGKVRLKSGECAVVAGLLTLNDSQTTTGIPGLVRIPFLRENTRDKGRTETLLVITPHITALPPSEFVMHEIWLGSETRPLSAI